SCVTHTATSEIYTLSLHDALPISVEPGSLVGLIGPNGAGKTTLIDAVTGMVRCSGDIRLEGRSIASWPAHRRSRAGIVRTFQSLDRKSTRLNSSHVKISYAVFCLK